MSEEALQIAVKTRDVISKEEKESYTHLNAEFQRIVRRDKKAFLSDQCREIEENNRMEKTRGLFKKIRDTKETFHAKMGSIKDRNSMDLTETPILRRGGKNTQKNCTKKIVTPQIPARNIRKPIYLSAQTFLQSPQEPLDRLNRLLRLAKRL